MGNQSSRVAGGQRETLYELFGLSFDCDAEQLKRAYRQRALELHPDRNAHRIEEATALFAKLQAAYDLLQDSQQRAWYDNQLKRPGYTTYNADLTSAEDVRRVAAEVLKSGRLNFLQISDYFARLKQEEQEAAFSQQAEAPFYLLEAPPFGSASDSWASVKAFYDAWSSFSTVKDFSWEDIHPVHEIADRKTRRRLEQQNKKLRDSAKREYNCCVKQAVTQLRQIDPRRQKPKRSPNPEPTPGATLEHKVAALQLREQYVEQDWARPDELPVETVECVACELTLETEFDLQTHNRSAAHKQRLSALKEQMLAEDELLREPPKPKLGKAKLRAQKKKQALLTCGTCGQQMLADEFIAHKRATRH